MPRVNYVKKALKDHGSCRCGELLPKGSPYIWWKFRYGPKTVRCPSCRPRPSELTNAKFSMVLAAVERIEDALDAFRSKPDFDALRDEVESAIEEIRECAEEYRESAEAIRDQFTESATADECDERADEIEGFADDLEALNIEPDEDSDDWAEVVAQSVEDAVGGCPL